MCRQFARMSQVPRSTRTTTVTLATTSAGPFDLSFRLFDAESIKVYINGIETLAFTLSRATFLDGYADDAQVTLTVAEPPATVIVIDSAFVARREEAYLNGNGLVDNLNVEQARQWGAIQDLQRDVSRSVRGLTPNDPVTVDPSAIYLAQEYAERAEAAALLTTTRSTPNVLTTAALAAITVPQDSVIVGGILFQANATGAYQDITGKKFAPAWFVTPRMFGAIGNGVADDIVAVQASWVYAAANRIPCLMEGLQYNCSDNPTTRSNLEIVGGGAILYPTEWPLVGGFFNNVVAGDALARVQSGIRIRDMICDGSKLKHPQFPGKFNNLVEPNLIGAAASWTNTNITSSVTAVTVPTASSTMRLLTDNATNGEHKVTSSANVATIGEIYGFHVIVQAGTSSKIAINMAGLCPLAQVIFDLTTGAVLATSGTVQSRRAIDLGLGFWALTISVTATAAATAVCGINMVNAANATSYVGTGSTVRVWGAWSEAGSGHNANLGPSFARGASNVRVQDCTARFMRRGYGGGSGGGGMGGEQGLQNVIFDGCIIENCFRGVRVAGVPGNHADAAAQKKNAIGVVFRDLTIRNCDTAVFCHSIGETGDDTSKYDVFDVLFDNIYIEDCGHCVWSDLDFVLFPTILPQKGGVITFAGAQNIRMRAIRVKLNTDYVTRADWLGRSGYPGSGTNYIGAGLSGNVGSLVDGWGRNIKIEDMSLDGVVDCARRFKRAVAFGEIASGPVGLAGVENQQNEMAFIHVAGFPIANVVNGWKSGATNSDNAFFSEVVYFKTYVALSDAVVKPDGVAPNGGLSLLANLQIVYGTYDGGEVTGTAIEWLAEPSTATQSGYMRKGGIELGGGYSATGTRAGVYFDTTASILRSSQDNTTALYHQGYYNANGLVGGIQTEASRTKFYLTQSAWISAGTGTPEGVVTAPIGCQWNRTDAPGGVYIKQSGAGNTGWVLK